MMARNPHADNFRDLIVYQKTRNVAEEIFIISKYSFLNEYIADKMNQ